MNVTGEQYVIEAGPYRAVAVEVGGGLRAATVDGRPLVEGYAAGELPDGGRGQVLAPWPNRVRDGRWTWRGRELQLPLNEPAKANASHGLVRWTGWTLAERDADRVVLTHRLHPQSGYPFRLDLTATYAVDAASGLSVVLTAVNAGEDDAPVALGLHPYLAPPDGERIDDCVLHAPASTQVLVDERSLPTGLAPAGAYDRPTPIGDTVLDVALTGRGSDEVRLSAGGRTTVVTTDAPWLQLFTGDTLAPARRRRGLAVEPLTAPVDALNGSVEGGAADVLAPGQALVLRWAVRQEIGVP